MALVIAIAQSKGGAGKTSVAVHLACSLGGRRTADDDVRKRVGLVDLDPLESLTKWFNLRESCLGDEVALRTAVRASSVTIVPMQLSPMVCWRPGRRWS